MIKTFVFDLGNTLIEYPEPEKLQENCLKFSAIMKTDRDLLGMMQKNLKEDRRSGLETHSEATVEAALSRALGSGGSRYCEADKKFILEEIYRFGFGLHASPVPGASCVLQELRRRGYKLGIVSNTPFPGEFFRRDLERFGLLQYFQVLVWSSEFGKRKPSPDIFHKALKDLGVSPEEAVYVGDKFDRDVAGSRGAGMHPVWFDRNDRGKDYVGHRIQLLSELMNIREFFV